MTLCGLGTWDRKRFFTKLIFRAMYIDKSEVSENRNYVREIYSYMHICENSRRMTSTAKIGFKELEMEMHSSLLLLLL